MPKEGSLRVWWIRNVPGKAFHTYVKSPKEAQAVLGELADNDLKRDDVTSNAGGLEVFEDGEWVEWSDEEGDDIDHTRKYGGRLA